MPSESESAVGDQNKAKRFRQPLTTKEGGLFAKNPFPNTKDDKLCGKKQQAAHLNPWTLGAVSPLTLGPLDPCTLGPLDTWTVLDRLLLF